MALVMTGFPDWLSWWLGEWWTPYYDVWRLGNMHQVMYLYTGNEFTGDHVFWTTF
jgi:hypothetical protein